MKEWGVSTYGERRRGPCRQDRATGRRRGRSASWLDYVFCLGRVVLKWVGLGCSGTEAKSEFWSEYCRRGLLLKSDQRPKEKRRKRSPLYTRREKGGNVDDVRADHRKSTQVTRGPPRWAKVARITNPYTPAPYRADRRRALPSSLLRLRGAVAPSRASLRLPGTSALASDTSGCPPPEPLSGWSGGLARQDDILEPNSPTAEFHSVLHTH